MEIPEMKSFLLDLTKIKFPKAVDTACKELLDFDPELVNNVLLILLREGKIEVKDWAPHRIISTYTAI
ncbi:hypothetical protein [Providencia rettgeri]|uniref:hypothetical protein n=1 Tax=Providencia rettgeri TaxID=587 RepID=UPI0015EC3737|nr:hypothetical protein [Providencia rettgeri]QLR05993.1 hypothetical protein H0913_06505 [Providencia rettgeri]